MAKNKLKSITIKLPKRSIMALGASMRRAPVLNSKKPSQDWEDEEWCEDLDDEDEAMFDALDANTCLDGVC